RPLQRHRAAQGRGEDRDVHARLRGEQRLPHGGRRLRKNNGGPRPRPRCGGVAAAGHAGDPRARPARRAQGHHPAVPDLLGDLRRRPEGARRRGGGDSMTLRDLLGQTVVVIGGSAGIGLETARRARAEGAEVILTGRNRDRLADAASEVGAQGVSAFDAHDLTALEEFFAGLESPVDHVMVTAGRPYYSPLVEMDFGEARRGLSEHLMMMLAVARYAGGKVRPGGTLVF